jgi:hypothetical protein
VSTAVELPASVAHGTYYAYIGFKCRCEPCRATYAAYRARRIARDPTKLTTYVREYMRKYRARRREERDGGRPE